MDGPAGSRVVLEIFYAGLDRDGLQYVRDLDDISRRRDIVDGTLSLSAEVQQRFRARFPEAPEAAAAPLVVHSTSWRLAPDGTYVLTWIVTQNGLDLSSRRGARRIPLRELTSRYSADPSRPDALPMTARDAVVHAAGHIGFLADHDPAVREALARDPATLALWRKVHESVAGNVELRRPLAEPAMAVLRRRGARRGLWDVRNDVFYLDIGPREVTYVEDSGPATARGEPAAHGSASADIRARLARRFPHAASDPNLVLTSTSWRQDRDGALVLNWMVIPTSLDLSREDGKDSVPLAGAHIRVGADAAAPDAGEHPARDVVTHGVENVAFQAAENPAMRRALGANPQRVAALERLRVARILRAGAQPPQQEVA